MERTEAVKCLRNVTKYAPKKGDYSSTKKFFEETGPSEEAVVGAGTLTTTRPARNLRNTNPLPKNGMERGQDNECPYVHVCKSQIVKDSLVNTMVGYLRAREWVKTHLEINVNAMNAVLGSPTGRLQISEQIGN